MIGVRNQIETVNENIIKEHRHVFAQKWLECFIHGSLKSRGRITESEWHNLEFVMTLVYSKGCLKDVLLGHAYLVETLAQIELRKTGNMA